MDKNDERDPASDEQDSDSNGKPKKPVARNNPLGHIFKRRGQERVK